MKYIYAFLMLFFVAQYSFGQQVVYSEPNKKDTKSMDFDIIGKVGGNYLILKNVRGKYDMSVYNRDMDEIDRVNMQFLDGKILNVDFITHPDFVWLIYQYQDKNAILLDAVKINGEGKLLTDPVTLDTSIVKFSAKEKIYSTIVSEDKGRVMAFKIRKEDGWFHFTTLLFDGEMNLLHRSKIESDFRDKTNVFSDFLLSNNGDFVFTAGERNKKRDFLDQVNLVTKAATIDTFYKTPIDLDDKYVDEIKLKVDNLNQHYLLNSFYYLSSRGNTEGIFTAVIDQNNHEIVSRMFAKMSDDFKSAIKSKGNKKTALNNFFIRNVILKNDGGFLLMAEDFYSESRYNPWNRWDYMYGGYGGYGYSPFYSPFYSYSPYYSPYYYGNRGMNDTRFYYNNIMVLSLDSSGRYDWTKVINKSQFDDQSDNDLSYGLMIEGGELRFLFNEVTKRRQILQERTINGEGTIGRQPPMHNLDKGYIFMPRYAKQVSASEMLVPCTYRNNIAFAKIQF